MAATSWGGPLLDTDYKALEARWITRQCADAAGLRRVDSITGREMFRRGRGDMAGIVIPNVAPWDPGHIREYPTRSELSRHLSRPER